AISPASLARDILAFNSTPPPYHSTLSLHDALPIFVRATLDEDLGVGLPGGGHDVTAESVIPADTRFSGSMSSREGIVVAGLPIRSEEHTSELQSRENLVCRLLLEKKKKIRHYKLFQ